MIRLTQRDIQTLHLLLAYRILTPSQLQTLLYPLSTQTRAQVNLQRLYRNKFVDRLDRISPTQPYIYLFSRYSVNGNKVMKAHYGEQYFKSKLTRLGAIQHLVGINDVRALTTRACQELGYTLVCWQSSEELAGKLPASYVIPDAYFLIRRQVDGQVRQSGVFLEIQFTIRSSQAINNKLNSFRKMYFSGVYNQVFGIRGMRALFVYAPTLESTAEARVKNGLKLAQQSGVTLAHFATLHQLKSAGAVGTLQSPIWRSIRKPEGVELFSKA